MKGEDQHPLYAYLTDKKLHPKTGGTIRWNFDKTLVDHRGQPIARYEPREDPTGKKVLAQIEKALAAAKKARKEGKKKDGEKKDGEKKDGERNGGKKTS